VELGGGEGENGENSLMRSLLIFAQQVLFGLLNRRKQMGGTCGSFGGERRDVYRVLMGKSEGRGPLGRPKRRWEGNTNRCLKEIGWGGVDWINLSQDMVS